VTGFTLWIDISFLWQDYTWTPCGHALVTWLVVESLWSRYVYSCLYCSGHKSGVSHCRSQLYRKYLKLFLQTVGELVWGKCSYRSLESQLLDEERMRPVDDFPGLGSVLWVLFDAVTIWYDSECLECTIEMLNKAKHLKPRSKFWSRGRGRYYKAKAEANTLTVRPLWHSGVRWKADG